MFDSGPTPGRPYFNTPTELGFLGFAVAKLAYYLFALVTGAFIVPLFGVAFLRAHPLALIAAVVVTVTVTPSRSDSQTVTAAGHAAWRPLPNIAT